MIFNFEKQKVYLLKRNNNLNWLIRQTFPKKDWNAPDTEQFETSNVPSEAYTYHTNFLTYLEQAYNTHQSIVLQPHVFWNMILNEVAGYVNENSEKCRELFTTSDKATEISIACSDIVPPLNQFEQELRKLVPTNIDLFLPSFTTSTEQSRFANIAAFMDTVSSYYQYSMFCCGYNAIRIDGISEDWYKVANSAELLIEVIPGLKNYLSVVSNTVVTFVDWIYKKDKNKIAEILTSTRAGSGGDTIIKGWVTNFYRKLPDGIKSASSFPSHIAKVNYTHNTFKRDFVMNYGLFSSLLDEDGFMVPDYGYVINEKIGEK